MTNPTDPDSGAWPPAYPPQQSPRPGPEEPRQPVWREPFQQGPPTLQNLPAQPQAQGPQAFEPPPWSQSPPQSPPPPAPQSASQPPSAQPFPPPAPQPPQQPPQQPWAQPWFQQPPQPPNYGPPPTQPNWPGGPPPTQPPAAPRSPRRRRGLIALIASVVVIAAALGLSLFFIERGSGNSTTGAASPAAAVRTAVAAIEHQDVGAALATVDPAEVKTLGAVIDLARQKLADTQIISASGLLVPGLNVTIRDLRTSVHQVNANLAFVTVSNASAAAAYDQRRLPAAVRPAVPRTERASAAGPLPFPIAVIKQDGGWYLSPTTTLLEELRRSAGLPQPEFTTPVTLGGGGSTPAAALTGLLSAVQNNDIKGAAGYISPAEVPALQYYYATFEHQVARGLSQVIGHISNVGTTVTDMSNGLKKVTIDSADLRITATDGSSVSAQYRAGCITVRSVGEHNCFPSEFKRLSGIKDVFVVVENDNGTWRISPVATLVEYARILVSDGSINAFYRQANLAELTPVTQTVHVGQPTTIHLNDGGFAHVAVIGPAHGCVAEANTDVIRVEGYPSCSGGGIALTAQGRGNAVVYNLNGDRAGQTTLTLQAR